MYNLVVITKYNAILLTVDDINDPDIQEILEQPWVVSAKYWKVSESEPENKHFKRLAKVKEGDNYGK